MPIAQLSVLGEKIQEVRKIMVMTINYARTLETNQTAKNTEYRRPGRPIIGEEMDLSPTDYRGRANLAIERYRNYAVGGFVSNDGNAIDVRRVAPATVTKTTSTGTKVIYRSPWSGTIDLSL